MHIIYIVWTVINISIVLSVLACVPSRLGNDYQTFHPAAQSTLDNDWGRRPGQPASHYKESRSNIRDQETR